MKLSPFRHNIVELMHRASKVPLVTAERRMRLTEVVDARSNCETRPAWTAIFTKALAIVALRRPELRRAYLSFPWPRLYEHPANVATVIIEREVDGEEVPLNFRIRSPESSSLVDLHQMLMDAKRLPVDEVPLFRRMRTVGSLPWPLRRWAWNFGYHWSGKKRAHYYGTFGVSSPASSGAGLTTILSPLALTLHYGLFDDAGNLDLRLTFDHRVLDGAPVARALREMEQVLKVELLDELKTLPLRRHAA